MPPKPSAKKSAKKSAPSKTPAADTLRVGLSAAAVRRWAEERGVEDLLPLPSTVVSYPRGVHIPPYAGDWWTVGKLLSSRPASPHAYWSNDPAREVIQGAIDWMLAAATETRNARTRPLTPAPAPPELAAAAERIERAAARLETASGPPIATPSFEAQVRGVDPIVTLTPNGPTACLRPTGRFSVNLEAEEPVRCECTTPPPACRARVHALRWLRARMGTPGWELAEPLAQRLAAAPWQRTLSLLESTAPKEPDGELGWAIDRRDSLVLRALNCRRTKNGTYKTTYLDKSALAEAATREDLLDSDRVVLDILRAGGGGAAVFAALRALVGHPRVFDAETRAPASVRYVPVRAQLDRSGDALVVRFRLGEVDSSAVQLHNLLARHPDGRVIIALPDGLDIGLAEVSPAVAQLADVLARRGDRFALDAVPELLRHFAALKLPVDADPSLQVRHVRGDTRPVVRIQAGTAPLLRVEVRSRAHPSLGVSRPGDGAAGHVGREGDTCVLVERQPAREIAAAEALVTRLGLPESGDWSWGVDEPEAAVELVTALRDAPDAVVEWGGRRPELRTAAGKNVRVQIGRGTDWFGVGGAVNVGGATVSLDTLLEAMRSGRSWVRAEGEVWVRVEERLRESLRALADATDADGRIAPVHAGAIQALEEDGVEVDASVAWLDRMERMRAAARLQPTVPTTLRASLRPYQVDGFAWMTRLLHWAGGAVLADDMGLGKTVQALAVLLDRAAQGPQLVVAPMSVGFNWVREAERFAPDLRARLHHGAARELGDLAPGDLVVTTWDLLVRDEPLRTIEWATVVFDEAQAVKNAETQRAKAAAAVKSPARVALTGTPIENRLAELWSLFNVVLPGLLGSAASFRGRFVGPIERDADAGRRLALARMVRPFLLRRVKSQVATDLPPRTEIRVDVELGLEERRRYDALRLATVQALADDQGPKEQLRFRVLAALTRLRQIACASRLVDEAAPARSAKIDRLLELLAELRDQGRRVLVFSQFAELIRHVRPLVEAEGLRVCHLDGSTPPAQRRAEVDRFQAGDADVFLISLKAGGTGLNLTAASEVILLDPWWNPAVEDQAADRTHRIGQTQAVTVYRLVARGTVEDGILELHDRKRDLAGAVLEGTADAGALSVEELVALLAGEEREKPSGDAKRRAAAHVAAAAPAADGGAAKPAAAPAADGATPVSAADPQPAAAPPASDPPPAAAPPASDPRPAAAAPPAPKRGKRAGKRAAPPTEAPVASAARAPEAPVASAAGPGAQPPAVQSTASQAAAPQLDARRTEAPATAAEAPKTTRSAEGRDFDTLAAWEAELLVRVRAGQMSRAHVCNSVNPLRRLVAWAGTLEGVEDRLDQWRLSLLDIPSSDRKLVPSALKRLRAWEAERR